jgi:hypothetical protein
LRRFLLLLSVWLVLIGHSSALAGVAGEGMHSEIRAERAVAVPVIDGLLREPVWSRAVADDSFTQHFPLDGVAPSMRTTVQVAFDDTHLYLGINAFDPDPSLISAPIGRRDSLVASDFIEIVLDTRHDHDNGYYFRINAAGVLADGEMHDDNRINFDWDAVWTGKAQTHAHGWSAEMAIPLSVLRFASSANPQFGFNVRRGIFRSGEIIQWVHIPRTASGTLSRAGHIVGLSGIKPKRAMELRPFGVIRLETALEEGGSAVFGDAHSLGDVSFGVDAKLGLTEGLTLDATINPDFGQVEADPVVLNLSSFETFFPEKRPFFLEGAGMLGTDIRLIHSRRIGQRTTNFGAGSTITLRNGTTHEVAHAPLFVPIYAAARVSGTLGERFSLNALSAVTGPERVEVSDGFSRQEIEVAPARSYSAMRGKYSLEGSSYLGFVATSVARLGNSLDPEANHDAFSESIDGRWVRSDGMYRAYFQLATAHRGGGDHYREGDQNCANPASCRPLTRADGSIQAPGDLGSAGEFGGAKAGGRVRLYGRYRFISPKFDVDAMGFENNWDFHQFVMHNSLQHEESFLWFRRAELAFNAHAEYGFDHTRRRLDLNTKLSMHANNFWTGSLLLEYKPPGSWTTRETLDGALFERSDEARVSFDIASDTRRIFSGGFGAEGLTSPSTEMSVATTYAYAKVRPSPPMEFNLQANLAQRLSNLRVLECLSDDGEECWLGSTSRDYTLALQDTHSLNITARASLAISTELSLEGYMQFFAAGGALHDYSAIYGQEGSHPQLSRDETEFLPFDGDSDRDGDRDDRFSFATVNANFVLRWEMFPGTTLIGVYTRSQRHSREIDRLAYAGLRKSPGEEILLLKLTLFAGL